MSLDLARVVAEALNRRPDDLMVRALELRGSPAAGPPSWWRDRLGLLKRMTFAPVRMRRRAKPLSHSSIVFDVGLTSEYLRARSAFVRKHFGEEVDFVSSLTPRFSPGGEREWRRWYRYGLALSLRALFDISSRRYFWLGQQLLEVQALALAAPGIERAYVFRLFDRRPYLAATYLARNTHAEVRCVFQNIPLWRNCRYFHLDVPVVVTSKVNLPEVTWLADKGYFRADEVLYRSQEFVESTPSPQRPTVDIGFFSSGEWARRDGLYQVKDVNAVKAGVYENNRFAVKAAWLADALARYARERGLTLRLYPHPYERVLLASHGVEAPWARLADGSQVSIATDGADSRANVYDPRAAVSLQSSFIWERLDLGLESSFMYDFGNDGDNAFKREALGQYEANLFVDETELYARLDEVLSAP
jgi:hypothetical protein